MADNTLAMKKKAGVVLLDFFLIESVFDLLIMDAHSINFKCICYFERYGFYLHTIRYGVLSSQTA